LIILLQDNTHIFDDKLAISCLKRYKYMKVVNGC